LVGVDKRSATDYVGMSRNFFNKNNGQQVYLNGFSAASGGDWWYDVMPNIYFYQLLSLYGKDAYPEWMGQFTSIADQWRKSVAVLGGNPFGWTLPRLDYRAFNLSTWKPLASGVTEPEAAGSIAWLLYKAYLLTGNEDYLQGAKLCLDALCNRTANPSYELQLSYGTQAAACLNARENCNFDVDKLINWCFDRGPLRGWGMINGKWGDYNASGLIGEANDGGNDYAFVMNGFQQAGALAPVAKYDKRYARALGKWLLHIAQASRLFYGNALPAANKEPTSAAWTEKYDKKYCIPYESIKQNWNGTTPYAMGDALRGKWAATNLSLYSGSSVGYLAAVVKGTDVEGIIQIDVNATDFFNDNHVPCYLYYNPYSSVSSVTLDLPSGSWDLRDNLTDNIIARNVSTAAKLAIPADGSVMVAIIPAGHTLTTQGNKLMDGDKVVDYHAGYAYTNPMIIDALAASATTVIPGGTVNLTAALRNVPVGSPASYQWSVNGTLVEGSSSTLQWTAPTTQGTYTITLVAKSRNYAPSASVQIVVKKTGGSVPVISNLATSSPMPLTGGQTIKVTATLGGVADNTSWTWTVNGGTLPSGTNSDNVDWTLPGAEGIYTIDCVASNANGSSEKKSLRVIVRASGYSSALPILYYPLNGTAEDGGVNHINAVTVGGSYVADSRGTASAAFHLSSTANKLYTPNSTFLNFDKAVTVALWFSADQMLSREQFVVSHGSWEQRYKISITPEKHLRWTVNTTSGIVDLDSKETIDAGKYYHATAIFTGYSMELYINGKLENFAPHTGNINKSTLDLCYGAHDAAVTDYSLIGCLDEIRIYDSAITPADVAKLPVLWEISGISDLQAPQLKWHKEGNALIVTSPFALKAAAGYASDGMRYSTPISAQGGIGCRIDLSRLPEGVCYIQMIGDEGMVRVIKVVK
jgi:hypothetical protein